MRAAIFIDGAYLLNRVHEASFAPDYSKLADHFLAPLRKNVPLDLLRCYFYDCPPWMSSSPSEDERRRMASHDRFVAELEDLDRWSVRLGKLERRREDGRDVFAQKRVDVLLAVDMVRHAAAGHIQHAVVVAGDSDFIPAVMTAKDCGATVTIWCAADRTPHKELLVSADEVCYFDWKTFPTRARPVARSKPAPAPAPEPVAVPEARPVEEVALKKPARGGRGKKTSTKAAPPPPPPPPPPPVAAPVEDEASVEAGGNGGEAAAAGNGKRRRRGKRGGRRRKKSGAGGEP
jgi:uncharacterized LabA/DUF88 family protein